MSGFLPRTGLKEHLQKTRRLGDSNRSFLYDVALNQSIDSSVRTATRPTSKAQGAQEDHAELQLLLGRSNRCWNGATPESEVFAPGPSVTGAGWTGDGRSMFFTSGPSP